MKHIKDSKELILKKISEEMAQLKRDHDVVPDPYIKELILKKWNDKAREFSDVLENKIERQK